ncbi:hypothetical protein BDW68DRAFT_158563 [Aspergillus falconensis]
MPPFDTMSGLRWLEGQGRHIGPSSLQLCLSRICLTEFLLLTLLCSTMVYNHTDCLFSGLHLKTHLYQYEALWH